MKTLITGGNRGLGKFLADNLAGTSISRSNGFDITKDVDKIATLSLEYDVFINNAFDGPPHEAHANFAQSKLYFAVYDMWKNANKTGYIFNIGSTGSKSIVVPEPRFNTYGVSKAALEHASKQGSMAFRKNEVPFKTSLISFDRLDTELSRSRPNWTGNGINMNDILNIVKCCLISGNNTCMDEVTLLCNLNYKVE